MVRKVLLIGLFALAGAPSATARPVQAMPGVKYDHRLEWTAAGPISTYVITAPRPGGLYSLTALLSNNTIVGRETVSSMERRMSNQMTTIGVNGDFFNWAGGWPSGLLMQGGVIEHHPASGRSAVGVDRTGKRQPSYCAHVLPLTCCVFPSPSPGVGASSSYRGQRSDPPGSPERARHPTSSLIASSSRPWVSGSNRRNSPPARVANAMRLVI